MLDGTEKTEILVKQGNRIRLVNSQDVIYIESVGRKAVLYLRNETIEYYAKISSLETYLKPCFFRIHRAYLINLQYIKSYNKREVRMVNGDMLLISKYRFAEFQNTIKTLAN